MRRRLLISMLAVAIAAVLALGIPLGYVLGRLQVDDAEQALRHDAQVLATQLYQRLGAGQPVDASYAHQLGHALYGRYVLIRYNGKVLVHTGSWPGPRDYRSATWSVGEGNNPSVPLFEVTVEMDDSYLPANLARELLLVGAVALAAVGVAVVLGLLYARRI